MINEKPKPVLTWPGGKTRLAKYIVPLIPPHICYVEPFAGALGLFLSKSKSQLEVINDIQGDLVNFYRVVKYHIAELLKEFDWLVNSRKDFKDYLSQPGLTDVQRAARWFMRMKNAFSGTNDSYAVGALSGGSAFSSLKNKQQAIIILHDRLDQVSIENLDWRRCLKNYDRPTTFFFLDPPYVNCDLRLYEPWTQSQMDELAAALLRLKGKWILTCNDSAANRRLFGRYRMKKVSRPRGIANKPGQQKVFRELIVKWN